MMADRWFVIAVTVIIGCGGASTHQDSDGQEHPYHIISNAVYPVGTPLGPQGTMTFQVSTVNETGAPVRVLGAS